MNNAFTDYLEQLQARDVAPDDAPKVAPAPVAPSQAIGGAANEYLDSMRQRQDLEDGTLNAFARAHKANPDEWAKMLQKGEAAGLSREVMEQFPAEAERRARYDEAAKLSREAPKTAQWLARPDNAELAKDDTGPLAEMERIIAETVARVAAGGPLRKPYEFETLTKGAFQAGMDRMGKGSAGLGAAAGESLSEYVTGPLTRNRILPEDIGARIGAFYREQAKGWEAKAKKDRGDLSKLPWLGKAALQGVESMPGSVGAAVVGVMTRNPSLAAAFMAAPVGGEGYVDAREKNRSVTQSLTHGSSQAVIEYATEFIPAAKMLQDLGLQKTFLTTLRNNLAREMPGEQAATILQDLNDWATLNPDKPFADYIKARPGAAAETLVATIVATGGQVSVGRIADDTLRGNRGQADQAFMQSIGDAATASKLRERMPAKYRDLVDEIAKGGPVENIRIPAETFATYFQTAGLDPAAVAQEVGARNFDAALAAHTDIIIPVGDYAAKIAATEHHAALMPDIRLRDGDLTAREYEAYKADRAEMDARITEEASQEAGGEKKDALSIIEAHFRDQLLALGRSPAVADAYATAQARPIMRMAEEAGVDPMAIIEKYGLTVTSPLPDVLTKKGTTEASIDALLERLRTGDIPQDEAIYGQRLTDFLRKAGGVRDVGGDLKGRDLDKNLKPGQSRLVRDDGLDFDAALTAARQAGYLTEAPADRPDETGINDLLDALLQDEQDGVFSAKTTNDELLQLRGMLESLGGYLDSLGIDLTQITDNAQVRALMKQAGDVVGEMADGYTLAQSMDGGNPSPDRIAEAARQLAEVRAQYEGTDQWMKAPNGEPTKLNERQWLQVRTPMFKAWFGDWENDPAGASKVVDANGEPMVVYHGTDKKFTKINLKKGAQGLFWFTSDKSAIEAGEVGASGKGVIMELFAKIDGPANWKQYDQLMLDEFKSRGLDGAILPESDGTFVGFIIDKPTQIKSAIGNTGTFSGDTGNVLFQSGYIESPRGKRDDYTIDLFENETGIHAAARPDTAGVSGDIQPASALSRDDAPGTFATRTEIVEENTRKLGVDLVASPADAAQAMAYLARGAVERFDALVTDKDGSPLAVVGAFKGALSQAAVYPSTVVGEAFRIPGAANIWFAHNHPSGLAELSESDRRLNDQLAKAFEGSQIRANGILAIGKGKDGGREWVHTLGGYAMDTFGAASTPSASTSTPVVERVFISEGKLGPAISSPSTARQAVENIAGKESGVMLLDAQNTPVAFVPVDPETAGTLRTDGRMDAMYRAFSMANAAAAIIVNNGDMTRIQVINLSGLFNSLDVRVIDVFETDSNYPKSWAEIGRVPQDTTFYQSADDKLVSTGVPATLRMMHGSPVKDIRDFITDAKPAASKGQEDANLGVIWFTDNETDAKYYASGRTMDEQFPTQQGGSIYQRTLKLSNPLVVYDGFAGFTPGHRSAVIKDARNRGHDSVVFESRDVDEDGLPLGLAEGREVAVFDVSTITDINFNQSADDKRGYITIGADRKLSIALLEKANLSTFLHEVGHAYLEIMGDLAESAGASEQLKADWAKALKFLKVATRADIGVEQHEMWARANEAYLMEGNAPSAELRGVFQKFKSWLKLIYRQIEALNVKLTPEVRGVFDRLYASEAEIESAKKEAETRPLFLDAAAAGMTEAEFSLYTKAIADGTETAKENLESRLMREQQRETQKWWKEARDTIKAEVTAEVDATPVYRAFAALAAGQMPDGTPIRLSRDDLVKRYGDAWLKKLPRGFGYLYTKEGGADIQTAAEMMGFSGADLLVNALADMRPKKELIEAETDARMRDTYGDTLNDAESMRQAAVSALHNDRQAEVLALELRALRKRRLDVAPFVQQERARAKDEKQAARAVVDAIPPLSAFRDAAAGMISQMQARDIRPGDYLRASQKANRDAFKAMAKDDHQAAYEAKRRELLNHYLYREALAAREEIDKILDKARSFEKPATRQRIGKAGADYLEQIDGLLERWEFKRVTQHTMDRRTSLSNWAEAMEAAGHAVNVAPELLDDAKIVNFREASMDTLRAVRDALVNIEHLAGLKNKLLKKKGAIEWEAVETELLGALAANTKSIGALGEINRFGESIKAKGARLWRRFDAAHLKVEQIVEWLDGGKIDGPWARYFFDLADDAQTREYDLHKEITKRLQDLSESMPKEWRDGLIERVPGFSLPGISASQTTRATLISIALNAGNTSNLNKMLRGHNWTPEQLDLALKQMGEADWRFVQGVWDTLETLWPEIAALEKRVSGVEPPRVDAREIETEWGVMRGGYYPMVYDPKRSSAGEKQADATESVQDFMARGYGRASTSKGHTKARIDEFSAPLRLDYEQVLSSHLSKVIKDISHREAVIGLTKILKSKTIKPELIDRLGEEKYTLLNEWVQTLISDRADTLHQSLSLHNALFRGLRTNTAIVTMGWKISTMMSQIAGFGPSVDLVGYRNLSAATVAFTTHPKDTLAMVFEKSGEMRHRTNTIERDMKEQLLKLRGNPGLMAATQRTAFYLTAMADRMVSVPTWLAGYRKALADGLAEDDAVRAGDRAVRLSQGAGGAKDLAAVQRQSELMKLLTMYYTPFSVLYARLRDVGQSTNSVRDLPRLAARSLALVILPAVLGELLAGRGPDDDEDEVWYAARKAALYPTASVPILRDLVAWQLEPALVELTGGTMHYQPRYQFSPILSAVQKIASIPDKTIDAMTGDREWDEVAWDVFEASGYVFGLPTAQPRITGEYLTDLMGGDANPESIGEALHDLAFRRPRQ